MIGYPHTPEPLTGERAKELAEKYLQKGASSDRKTLTVKLPDKFAVNWPANAGTDSEESYR